MSVPHMLPALFALPHTSLIATTTLLIAQALAKPCKLAMQKLPFKTEPPKIKQAWLKSFSQDPGHLWLRKLILELFQSFTN